MAFGDSVFYVITEGRSAILENHQGGKKMAVGD